MCITSKYFQNHYMENCSPLYREATDEELRAHSSAVDGAPVIKYGTFFKSIVVECKLFLPWALNKYVSSSLHA